MRSERNEIKCNESCLFLRILPVPTASLSARPTTSLLQLRDAISERAQARKWNDRKAHILDLLDRLREVALEVLELLDTNREAHCKTTSE